MKYLFMLATAMFTFCTLSANVVVTSGISRFDFVSTFTHERVWYAQFQPGGADPQHPDNQFELGNSENVHSSKAEAFFTANAHYTGNAPIIDEGLNSFEINASETAFLSVTFNGVETPGGNHMGITEAVNTIWVGLMFNTPNGFDNTVEVNTQTVDGTTLLPDLLIQEQMGNDDGYIGWSAFKFHITDQLDNIDELTIAGNITPDMFFGGAAVEDWTYTVFATYDPTIVVPEPQAYALILGLLMILCVIHRRRQ